VFVENPKKMNILLILEVLKKHSNEYNMISQKKIADLVEQEYNVTMDRHILRKQLGYLDKFECGVEPSERDKKTDEPAPACLWYFEREVDITDGEMRMLIDGLLFSKYIPYSECKKLVEKLKSLASPDFLNSSDLPENRPENKEIFLSIEELMRAISKGKKVSFNYLRYEFDENKDNKPSIVLDKDGKPRIYTVSPYEIVVANGYYYLICAREQSDMLYHYRLNYICNIEVLKSEKRRSIRDIPGYKNGLKLSEYMNEHPYMMASGDIVRVFFRFEKWVIGHVYEWFGKDIKLLENKTEDTITATIRVNERAMLYWALQYGMYVEVLGPQSLRNQIHDAVTAMAKKYK